MNNQSARPTSEISAHDWSHVRIITTDCQHNVGVVPDNSGILHTIEGRAPGQDIPKEEPTLDLPLTLNLHENI